MSQPQSLLATADLYKLARGYNRKYSAGAGPFHTCTRLLEECGEVAQVVNLFEDTGIKRAKYGDTDPKKLAGELSQVMLALAQLAVIYNVEDELDKAIISSLDRMREGGFV